MKTTEGLLLLSILVASEAAEGNFAASVEFLGFSSDGRYFAWEQYGVQDGSGFPFSSAAVQETEGGAVVWSREIVLEDEGQELERARELCRTEAAEAMCRISARWLPGTLCVHHPPTDLTAPGDSVRFHSSCPAPGFFEGDRTVSLTTRMVAGSEMEQYWGLIPVMLSVSIRDNVLGTGRVLLEDDSLAESRSYVSGYGIESVWALGDSAFAVSIAVMSLGFEGQDLSYMFVGWCDPAPAVPGVGPAKNPETSVGVEPVRSKKSFSRSASPIPAVLTSAIRRPRSMIPTLSHIFKAIGSVCVERTTAAPESAAALHILWNVDAEAGSSPTRGSSMTYRSGLDRKAAERTTRWVIPWE